MRRIVKAILIMFVLFVGLILYIVSNQIGGFRAFIVSSSSMEPAINTGSLVITKYIPPNTLQKNDIITFIPPIKQREFVTHRISEVSQKNNVTILKTKGDNNKNEDPWILAGGAVVGKVIYSAPYLGYFLTFVQTKPGIILFILLPAAYIIINEIYTIIYTVKSHKKRNNNANALDISVIYLLLCLSTTFFSTQPTRALLSDSADLISNKFIVIQNNQDEDEDDQGENDDNQGEDENDQG